MFDDEQSPTHKTAQKFLASGPFYVMAKYLLIDSRYLSAYQVS
jgi:hypothetical protein